MGLSGTAVRNWNKKSVPVLSRRATWSTFFFQATKETGLKRTRLCEGRPGARSFVSLSSATRSAGAPRTCDGVVDPALNKKPLVGTHCILFHGVSAHRRRRQRKVVRCRNARDRHLVVHQAGDVSTLKVVLEQTGRRRCAGRIPASLEDVTRLTCSPHICRTVSLPRKQG